MGISNENKAVCDVCGEARYSEKKQSDFLKELKEDGWQGSINRLKCDRCAAGRRPYHKKHGRRAAGEEKNVNRAELIGNLTRDPVLKYSSNEKHTAVCRFTIAVNEGYGEKQKTSFISIVTFGTTAENCSKYLSKGRKVAVSGRIQSGSYEKDGRTVYTTDVIAGEVEFLSGGQQEQQSAQQMPAPKSEGQEPEAGTPAQEAPQDDALYNEGFFPMDDEDIPF